MILRTKNLISPIGGLLLATLLATMAGCATQRPLHILHADAANAAKFGDAEVAKADYEEYITRKPDDPEKRYEYSQVLMKLGDYRGAMEQLNIACDVDPTNDKYLDAYAEAMFAANERDALTTNLTRATLERGRVSDYLRLGRFSVRLGNADEAQQSFLTAAKLDQGRTVGPQLELAEFYGSMGDRPRQIRRLRMAYAIEPANPDVLAKARELGEVVGPSFGLMPEEAIVP